MLSQIYIFSGTWRESYTGMHVLQLISVNVDDKFFLYTVFIFRERDIMTAHSSAIVKVKLSP
jgi:hypothetical protein